MEVNISIKGEPKEIAALALELQGRREVQNFETFNLVLDEKDIAKAIHDNLAGRCRGCGQT